jgi:hypothetical protein
VPNSASSSQLRQIPLWLKPNCYEENGKKSDGGAKERLVMLFHKKRSSVGVNSLLCVVFNQMELLN